ncbi:hypothetical protein [Brevibacillus thermoruber]|uniref:hypothetical protein n=1 Tax=Brevibacillus thermoruber TaxID=33942 RepID=UPI00068B8D68|nr:hypothetical protein [Brevibacillus thermoruber]
MSFGNYFYEMAHRIFKLQETDEENDIFYFAHALGKYFDKLKADVFKIRREALIATASEKALALHGRDRNMPRYRGESVEEYRNRLLAAVPLHQEIGTEPGMKRALALIGYPGAIVFPFYKLKYSESKVGQGGLKIDGTWKVGAGYSLDTQNGEDLTQRWAEFLVDLNEPEQPFLPHHLKIVKDTIQFMKPAEARLYSIRFNRMAQTKPAPDPLGQISLIVTKEINLPITQPVIELTVNKIAKPIDDETRQHEPIKLTADPVHWKIDGSWKIGGSMDGRLQIEYSDSTRRVRL